MLIKVFAVGVCSIVINSILKQYKPEFAIFVNVCAGLIIFMITSSGLQEIISEFINIQDDYGLKINIISPVLKVLGVGYITEFAADIAEDSGNKAVANKLILGGKISICVLALPVIKQLLNAIISII